jgi:malonate transporter
MTDLLALFLPFFALIVLGWGAARGRLLPLDGIGALTSFVLYFGLTAMLFRLAASGALVQAGLPGLLGAYGLAGGVVLLLALAWSVRMRLSRRDGGLMALVSVFPNTGFLGLPLLTGLLGPQAAGPIAATLIIDVLLLSSVCLAWAHSHGAGEPAGDDPAEAWHAMQASLKGALRNPLLWSMAVGLAVSALGWHLPRPLDETVRLLGLSATPVALFALGAILARSQMASMPNQGAPGVAWLVALKLGLHPLLVFGAGWGLQQAGVGLSQSGLLTMTLAAALPSASNVSMLAEREGANTAGVAKVILWTTGGAVLTLVAWAHGLGVQAHTSGS